MKLAPIAAMLAVALASPAAFAQKKYDPGANDKEIRIGNTNPYSGPASAYGTIGKAIGAYFKMVNEQGGINGRKVVWMSYDDGYSPPKTVEMARKLVEQDQVLMLFQTLGTPRQHGDPQVHEHEEGAAVVRRHRRHQVERPAQLPLDHRLAAELPDRRAHLRAAHPANNPKAKIGILYQNDDYGKDYLKGMKDGLGDKVGMIVKEVSYEVTDPTVDSQIVQLQASGADTFFNITTPKFAAQAIRKAYDIGWKPTHYLNNVSASIGSVLKPAGLEKSAGLISTQYLKDPLDDQWKNDASITAWREFMGKYYPEGNLADASNVYGYTVAQTLHQVLKQAGNNLTRDNVMKQAAVAEGLSRRDHAAGHPHQHRRGRLRADRVGAADPLRRPAVEALRPDHGQVSA